MSLVGSPGRWLTILDIAPPFPASTRVHGFLAPECLRFQERMETWDRSILRIFHSDPFAWVGLTDAGFNSDSSN